MITAANTAKYLLTLDDQDAGDLTSNLKLQKLLYYSQGIHLAMRGGPLFVDAIEAWQHGPVCPTVYREYREHGAKGLPIPTEFDLDLIPAPAREVLDEVHCVYGQFSAWRLREMTHDEPPWRDHYREGVKVVIPQQAMREFFLTVLTAPPK
jgi:uncharacterized phage-associated protein